MKKSIGSAAMEGPSTGVSTEEPLVSADTEEPFLSAASEAPLASVASEGPLTGAATSDPSVCIATEETTAGAAEEDPSGKKLLVLDVNGLLVATYHKASKAPVEKHHARLGNFFVYERVGCEELLDFCFKHFIVGVWSSARQHNVSLLVNHVFKDRKPAFSWHQRHCTTTAVMHPDNKKKPIFLKELSKLWAEVDPGRFDQSNTLLIDDSPYKALKNPPHTAIFPRTYNGDEVDDNLLFELRTYLEGLRDATDVQEHVRNNPIGEPGISEESPLWSYFSSIVNEGAQELNLAVNEEVVNGMIPAAQVANELNPEEIELEDIDQPVPRRDLSLVGVSEHSSRSRRQASQDMGRESENNSADETHWRRNVRNAHESESDKTLPRRTFKRIRERSPRTRMSHFDDRRRFAPNHERDSAELVPHRRTSGFTDYTSNRRDIKSRGSWHDRSVARDPSFSRESYNRGSSDHDMGRPLPSHVGRQFMTSGINVRDLPPPPVFSAHDSGRGLLPSPAIPSRSWDIAERPTFPEHYESYGGRGHVTNVALNAPPELDRSWGKPVIPTRGRDPTYERRWDEHVSISLERGHSNRGLDKGYDNKGPARPMSSGRGNDYDRRWEGPMSSGRGHDYDRRWEDPVSLGRGPDYDRRWEDPARGSEHDRRWKEPVGNPQARGNVYDRRWKEPASAGHRDNRRHDSGWDRHGTSSNHGTDYDQRWGEPASLPSNDRGRGKYDVHSGWEDPVHSRWEDPVHSDYLKEYDRRWEQPGSVGSREYDSKWSTEEPPPRRPLVGEYSSHGGYRNSSASEYKGRSYAPADHRNIAPAGPRDDHRPHHWGPSNTSYRR